MGYNNSICSYLDDYNRAVWSYLLTDSFTDNRTVQNRKTERGIALCSTRISELIWEQRVFWFISEAEELF